MTKKTTRNEQYIDNRPIVRLCTLLSSWDLRNGS